MNTPTGIRNSDLTAKARIRNTALDLFGRYGQDRVSMRMVATEAGCTVGLVQHHFGSKEGLMDAVELEIIEQFVAALHGGPGDAGARDARVRAMFTDRPEITGYLRRALLDRPGESGGLLKRLVSLSLTVVRDMRATGTAKRSRPEEEQVVSMLVRQLGVLFLEPMIGAVWNELEQPETNRPQLRVSLTEADGNPSSAE